MDSLSLQWGEVVSNTIILDYSKSTGAFSVHMIQPLDPSKQSDDPTKPSYAIVTADARKNLNKTPPNKEVGKEVKVAATVN